MPSQEYQEGIEIIGVNKMSGTESKSYNVRGSDRERRLVLILESIMKLQAYMQDYKSKRFTNRPKRNQKLYFGTKQEKKIHKRSTSTTWSHRQLRSYNILLWTQQF